MVATDAPTSGMGQEIDLGRTSLPERTGLGWRSSCPTLPLLPCLLHHPFLPVTRSNPVPCRAKTLRRLWNFTKRPLGPGNSFGRRCRVARSATPIFRSALPRSCWRTSSRVELLQPGYDRRHRFQHPDLCEGCGRARREGAGNGVPKRLDASEDQFYGDRSSKLQDPLATGGCSPPGSRICLRRR